MNLKNIFLIIVVAIICIAIGYRLPSKENSELNFYKDKYLDLKSKMESIQQIDFQEYLQLKNQKEKYEKADEILGKILLLMVADFGLHSAKLQFDKLQTKSNILNKPIQIDTPQFKFENKIPDLGKKAEEKKSKRTFVKLGANANEIRSNTDLNDFLKSVEISNFMDELKNHGELSRDQLNLINGTFSGEIILDEKTERLQVIMEFNGQFDGEKPTAYSHIQIFDKGNKISDSTSGEGSEIKDFMTFADDKNAILINAQGNSGFFQLYYFPHLNQFSGNYYRQKGYGSFKREGIVTLKKQN